MNRFERLVAVAGLSVAAAGLTGCAETNQVNGIDIVDCQNDPKTAETRISLLFGEKIDIGGTSSGVGTQTPMSIGFEKGNGVSIRPFAYGEVIFFPDSSPQLGEEEVGLTRDGTVHVRSREVSYEIETSLNPQGGTLNIKASCDPQSQT